MTNSFIFLNRTDARAKTQTSSLFVGKYFDVYANTWKSAQFVFLDYERSEIVFLDTVSKTLYFIPFSQQWKVQAFGEITKHISFKRIDRSIVVENVFCVHKNSKVNVLARISFVDKLEHMVVFESIPFHFPFQIVYKWTIAPYLSSVNTCVPNWDMTKESLYE